MIITFPKQNSFPVPSFPQIYCIMKLLPLTIVVLLLVADESTADRILSRRTKRELASPLHVGGIRDPFGSYCQRRGGCCPGRDDLCTVPYLDTICYCDLFCNRTVSDCCPDFWGHCLGIERPFIGMCCVCVCALVSLAVVCGSLRTKLTPLDHSAKQHGAWK